MKLHRFSILLFILILASCESKKNVDKPTDNYEQDLVSREKEAGEKQRNEIGELIKNITFNVKADKTEFEDGIQPWASIEKPKDDLDNLIDKNENVITANNVTVIIDYPLKNEYKFQLESSNGFTREKLLIEISKHYFTLYEEEEKTATIKTLPMEKRTMYNRNETNGKYGIWGHDIADLVLTDVYVYKTKNGKIILTLNVDS